MMFPCLHSLLTGHVCELCLILCPETKQLGNAHLNTQPVSGPRMRTTHASTGQEALRFCRQSLQRVWLVQEDPAWGERLSKTELAVAGQSWTSPDLGATEWCTSHEPGSIIINSTPRLSRGMCLTGRGQVRAWRHWFGRRQERCEPTLRQRVTTRVF